MNGHSPTASTESDDRKWGALIAGASIVGIAACLQFAYAGLHEHTLAKLPASVAHAYSVAGKLILTVPLAALGVLLVVGSVVTNLRERAAAPTRPAPARRPTPSRADFQLPDRPPSRADFQLATPNPSRADFQLRTPNPSRAEFQLPGASVPTPLPPGLEEELEVGEPIPDEELQAEAAPPPAPPGRFEGRAAATRKKGTGTQATMELASAKYLNRLPPSGRASQPGA